MASIVSVATAVPPFAMAQSEARCLAGAHFAGRIPDVEKYLQVFKNALVDTRYFCVEPAWFAEAHSLAEKNDLYLVWAKKLCLEAIEKSLGESGTRPEEIDTIILVSSSGIATPSLDVALINTLGLRPDVRRVPIFGLGCGGGAAGIALAKTLAGTGAGATVLLVAVELNSLTFQPDDLTKSNLVATSIFGDGAAAVIVKEGEAGGLELVKSVTFLRRGTNRLMGWDFVDSGFRVVFSRRVPEIIRGMMPEAVGQALEGSGIGQDDVASLIFHPGGKRILEAYEAVLKRGPEDFRASYAVLSRYGNMSSATVLFVLADEMKQSPHRSGDYGLIAAFGPGFSAEATLVRYA